MLVSIDVGEQRVAVLEDGKPVEVYLERPGRRSIAGNVYKGIVDTVLPGMEASFVDIGLEKNGFLYVDEIVVPELEGKRHGLKIQELVSRGQEVLVQAVKDPMGTKGARLTTEVSLAGRFLVYTPFGDGIGVSRRLEDDERDRLKAICKGLELPEGGIIVRTAAEGASEPELAGDLAFLRKLWSTIQSRAERAKAPALVYQEAELPLRVLRDVFRSDFIRLAVDHEQTYRRIVGYLKRTSAELAERVEWYREIEPIMEAYGVEAAVRSTLNRRVDLPSGGYLVFDYAEAFTVIDVNTGRFVGARGKGSGARLEDTITKNNLEAVKEIVRQLRLRDIGGIIVIDFIDMANPKNRRDVEEALRTEFERDRTKTYVVEISPLGLVEMTRQNVTDGPREILTTRCATCEGNGIVVSFETHAVDAERRLRRLARESAAPAFLVELPSRVAGILIGPAGSRLAEIERETGKMFAFEARDDLAHEHFAVLREGTATEIAPQALPVSDGQELEIELLEKHAHHPDDAIGRLDGYVIAVGGAGGRVGETVLVRIERATRTVAYATVAGKLPDELEAPVEAGTLAEQEEAAAPTLRPRRTATPKVAPVTAEAEEGAEETVGDAVVAEGDPDVPPKKKTRRGTRGGRGRKKPVGAVDGAEAGEVEASPEETSAQTGESDVPGAEPTAPAVVRRPPQRSPRTRTKPPAEAEAVGGESAADPVAADGGDGEEGDGEATAPKKRTRRGSRGGRGRRRPSAAGIQGVADGNGAATVGTAFEPLQAALPDADQPGEIASNGAPGETAEADGQPTRRPTRRGSRGGRGRKKPAAADEAVAAEPDAS
jgi:ribonuclease G